MIIGVENIIKMISNATILDEEQLSEKEIDDIKESMEIISDSIDQMDLNLQKSIQETTIESLNTALNSKSIAYKDILKKIEDGKNNG